MSSRIPTENQLPLARHGIDCDCCSRDDGSDSADWDHWDLLVDDPYLSPLPVMQFEELCVLCHQPVSSVDHGLCDACETAAIDYWLYGRELALAARVAVLVTPPLCLMGETQPLKSGVK